MQIIADTHVHLYADYALNLFLDSITHHLTRLAGDESPTFCIICLTERYDCDYYETFSRMSNREIAPGWTVRSTDEPEALRVEHRDGWGFNVLAGRQIVTRERLEVLALATRERWEDGRPVEEVLREVREAGGIPVLPWAPGKWFFNRGRIVKALLDRFEPGSFLLGDSSLRPTCWPRPGLMAHGEQKGFRVVAGSDPLPFAGEETVAGTYATKWVDEAFDPHRPVTSFKTFLLSPGQPSDLTGRRSGPLAVSLRLWRNARSKRETAHG